MQEYKTFYRAIGLPEWRLIHQQGRKRFCPSLLRQRIFFPSLQFDYANRLAKEALSRREDCDFTGLVCAFDVPPEFLSDFEALDPENTDAEKLWLPAELSLGINEKLNSPLRIVEAYYGPDCEQPQFTPLELSDDAILL